MDGLRSPCRGCKTANLPACREACLQLKAFQAKLDKVEIHTGTGNCCPAKGKGAGGRS